MFEKRKLSRAVASVLAVSASGGAAHAAIEEVVVTATKRQESMQDVPVSVTALQGDKLDEL